MLYSADPPKVAVWVWALTLYLTKVDSMHPVTSPDLDCYSLVLPQP